jgi:hypothetical protein
MKVGDLVRGNFTLGIGIITKDYGDGWFKVTFPNGHNALYYKTALTKINKKLDK